MSGLGILCQCCHCGDAYTYWKENGELPGLMQYLSFAGNVLVRPQPNNLWLGRQLPLPPDLTYGHKDGHGLAHPRNPPVDTNAGVGTWYGFPRPGLPLGKCAFRASRITHHLMSEFHPTSGLRYQSEVAMYVHFVGLIDLDELQGPHIFGPPPLFNYYGLNGFMVHVSSYGQQAHSDQVGIAVNRCYPWGFIAREPAECDVHWGSTIADFVDGAEFMFILDRHQGLPGLLKLRVWYADELVLTFYCAADPEDFDVDELVEDWPELEDQVIHELRTTGDSADGDVGLVTWSGIHCSNGTMEVDDYRAWSAKSVKDTVVSLPG